MRVAIIYQYIYPQNFGGGEKRLYEIFSRFPKNIEIDWFVQYQENYDSFYELKRFSITAFEKNKKNDVRRSILEIFRYCYFLLTRVDLRKYDIIHIGQMPFFHILALQLKSKIMNLFYKKTAYISIDWWEFWGNYWLTKHGKYFGVIGAIVERMILFLATHLIVISPKTYKDVNGKTRARLELIHNGVDFKKINAVVSIEKKYDFIILGRLEEWKNPMMGVQVFQKMLEQDSSLKLLIVGDGSYAKFLNDYIMSNNIQKNVFMHGKAADEQIFSLLKNAKMMLLFSKQEGGGSITLFEANACGLPVATASFENGIDREIVTIKNGFFFTEHDHNFIASELLKVLKSDDLLHELSETSKDFVKNFDWSILSKQYFDFFENILKERQ